MWIQGHNCTYNQVVDIYLILKGDIIVWLDASVPVVTLNKFCGGFQLALQHKHFLRKLVALHLQSVARHNRLLQ
jgi:hypothetical protein